MFEADDDWGEEAAATEPTAPVPALQADADEIPCETLADQSQSAPDEGPAARDCWVTTATTTKRTHKGEQANQTHRHTKSPAKATSSRADRDGNDDDDGEDDDDDDDGDAGSKADYILLGVADSMNLAKERAMSALISKIGGVAVRFMTVLLEAAD